MTIKSVLTVQDRAKLQQGWATAGDATEPGKIAYGSKFPRPLPMRPMPQVTMPAATKLPTMHSGQTARQSMIETLAGTAIGFVVALLAQIYITRRYDIPSTFAQDAWITVFFTGISIIRGYCVRRFFNRLFKAHNE